jgi:membrane-bound inhibitor of C-type lysozyme
MNRLCTSFLTALLLAGSVAQAATVKTHGPVTYVCGDGTKVTVTYFEGDPPTASIAVNGDKPVLGTAQATGSGARYANESLSLWEHQRVARVEIKGQKTRECPLEK